MEIIAAMSISRSWYWLQPALREEMEIGKILHILEKHQVTTCAPRGDGNSIRQMKCSIHLSYNLRSPRRWKYPTRQLFCPFKQLQPTLREEMEIGGNRTMGWRGTLQPTLREEMKMVLAYAFPRKHHSYNLRSARRWKSGCSYVPTFSSMLQPTLRKEMEMLGFAPVSLALLLQLALYEEIPYIS